MSELESAEEYTLKLLGCQQRSGWAALIEARDNAVRAALAAEIQASALALDDTGLTFTWREAVIRAIQVVTVKYTQPKDSGSVTTWASTGAVDITTCEGSLRGVPVKLTCEVTR